MKHLFLATMLAVLSSCAGAPALAQTIGGCGSVAIAPADASNAARLGAAADCFDKAKVIAAGAEQTRRDRIAALTPVPAAKPNVLDEGDSISLFWGGNHTGIYAASHPSVIFHGQAHGGSWLRGTPDGNDVTARFAADATYHPNFVTVLIGANDISSVGPWASYKSTDEWLAALWSYTAQWHATGAKIAVGTILPQCTTGNPAAGTDLVVNTNRKVINEAIRAAVGRKIDAVIDYAADPVMGPDNAACDATLYQPGGLHPTDGAAGGLGGQGKLAVIYTAALDAMIAGKSQAVAPPPSTAVTPIASNFDTSAFLTAVPIPVSAAPDVVGAFRFICNPSHESRDDPIVYPGQPGKSHLHEFFGNTLTDANSTYQSLRATGDSTCGNKLNRSGYWQPAMNDGHGSVVRPDYWQIYYKRPPQGSPLCTTIAQRCAAIPDGLRFIFGYDMVTMTPATGDLFFACVSLDGQSSTGGGSDMAVAEQGCVAPNHLEVRLHAPDCWNGVDLDSPNHRSHVAYSEIIPGTDGQPHCPAGFPVLIPTFTLAAMYTVDGNLADWRFSSDDDMKAKPGTTFHSDFFSAWDPATEAAWTGGCIDKMLNCSAGDLGNGTALKADPGFSWTANPRLVAVP